MVFPMNLILDLLRQVDSIIPTFGADATAGFHLVALAGLAYSIEPNIVSFKGGRVRVFNSYVPDWLAALGVLILLVLLATINLWIDIIYRIAILNGQGALGVIVLLVPGIILRKSQRRFNLFWAMFAAVGLILLVASFV